MLDTLVKKDPASLQISGNKISDLGLYKREVLILWNIFTIVSESI